jgi:hypothetical protein
VETIVYTMLRPHNRDVYLFEEPGGTPRRRTDDLALDYGAVFSPYVELHGMGAAARDLAGDRGALERLEVCGVFSKPLFVPAQALWKGDSQLRTSRRHSAEADVGLEIDLGARARKTRVQ